MTTDRFNIDWQVARVNARSIKDIDTKIDYVFDFLTKHGSSKHNYDRVKNWLNMSRLGYKNEAVREIFEDARATLEDMAILFNEDVDTANDFAAYDDTTLLAVWEDLSKRKYNFQFKGRMPETHVIFMHSLHTELVSRGVDID